MITQFLNLQQSILPKPAQLKSSTERIQSIDILRGAVMVIMALDHVRDFIHIGAFTQNPTDLNTTTPVLFLTRWITHFCAPIFIFLSGISAFISGQKKSRKELSTFLIKRGAWLLIVELVIVNFSLSFDPYFRSFFLQVIWAIGWSMIILGALVRTSLPVIAIVAALLLFGHNLVDYANLLSTGTAGVLCQLLLTGKWTVIPMAGSVKAIAAYAILPWTAVMLLGYIAGNLYKKSVHPIARKNMLVVAGLSMLILFFFLRILNQYGDPSPWSLQKNGLFTFFSFFNVTKYPVSLQYTCMTLGPALILLAVLEQSKNRFSRFLIVYGKVPFFYYIIHFYLIHLICMVIFFGQGYSMNEALDPSVPLIMYFRPLVFGVSLTSVYLVWIALVASLYYPCKWFGQYKQTHRHWWLSYI
jgi:uncharacterized membrane protein